MKNKKIDEPYNLPTIDDFFESMEDVRMYLKNNNLEYKNTQQKLHNILDNNINIQKIFDEADIENGLSKEECKMLSKIIILNYKLQEIKENEKYFKGGMDAYFYFRKLGILK